MTQLPLNPCSARQSQLEVQVDGTIVALDPTRAHEAVGDPDFKTFVPACAQCQAKALAEKALQEVLDDQSKR